MSLDPDFNLAVVPAPKDRERRMTRSRLRGGDQLQNGGRGTKEETEETAVMADILGRLPPFDAHTGENSKGIMSFCNVKAPGFCIRQRRFSPRRSCRSCRPSRRRQIIPQPGAPYSGYRVINAVFSGSWPRWNPIDGAYLSIAVFQHINGFLEYVFPDGSANNDTFINRDAP